MRFKVGDRVVDINGNKLIIENWVSTQEVCVYYCSAPRRFGTLKSAGRTLHSGYPTNDENIIDDKNEQCYIMDRLEKHKRDCEFNLQRIKNVIENIKL